MIFPEFERSEAYHRAREVSSYEFLNYSSWQICGFYSKYVNENISTFLEDNEFISRFKSDDDYHHRSASFEFLVYRLFIGQGFLVEKHPDLGTRSRADFRVLKENKEIILECTLTGSSFIDAAVKNRMSAVESIVDEMHFFPYWINIKYSHIHP